MENSIRYYKYHLGKSWLQILISALVTVLIVFPTAFYESRGWYSDETTYQINPEATAVLLIGFAVLIAIRELKPFNNRRNLDMWYSMPISRQRLLITNFLVGLTEVGILYIISMVLWVIEYLGAPSEAHLRLSYLPPLMWLVLVFVVEAYALTFAIYSFANNHLDGVLFVGGHLFIYPLIAKVVYISYYIFSDSRYYEYRDNVSLYKTITRTIDYYSNQILSSRYSLTDYLLGYDNEFPTASIIGVHVWLLVGIGLFALCLWKVGRRDASKVEGVSDTWFGYKTLIPAYALCSCLWPNTLTDNSIVMIFVMCVIYAVCLFVAYVIYRRGLHFKKIDLILMATLVAVKIVMMIVYSNFDLGETLYFYLY